MKILIAIFMFLVAQILAWFQSNSGIIGEPFKSNYIAIAIVLGPIVSVAFAYATILLYESMPLWSITLKNVISFSLCVALMCIQFFMK